MGKVLTVATIVEKFKINGSVARKVLTHFSEKGEIIRVGEGHSKFQLYTLSARAQAANDKKKENEQTQAA